MPLLTDEELENIFHSYALHEKNSFFIIDKETKEYQTNRHRESFVDDAQFIKEQYESGHTIVVKNMEYFNASIQEAAEELGPGTDVHLYLTPTDGDSFGYHVDDRNVWVRVLKGIKIFALKFTGMTSLIKLHEGNTLYIPMDLYHKADTIGPSVLLSFGVLPTIPVSV